MRTQPQCEPALRVAEPYLLSKKKNKSSWTCEWNRSSISIIKNVLTQHFCCQESCCDKRSIGVSYASEAESSWVKQHCGKGVASLYLLSVFVAMIFWRNRHLINNATICNREVVTIMLAHTAAFSHVFQQSDTKTVIYATQHRATGPTVLIKWESISPDLVLMYLLTPEWAWKFLFSMLYMNIVFFAALITFIQCRVDTRTFHRHLKCCGKAGVFAQV